MKFLCIKCDQVMSFAERQLPGDGTLAAVFSCPGCAHEMAMLTNPMETQLVSSLGVRIGGRTVPEQPMELTRSSLDGTRADVFIDEAVGAVEQAGGAAGAVAGATESPVPGGTAAPASSGPVRWDPAAVERLGNVPSFVRGMVKRIYTDWAHENGVAMITPEVMDRARTDLGLEGM